MKKIGHEKPKLPAQAQPTAVGPHAPSNNANAARPDDIIDAEFEEVKDKPTDEDQPKQTTEKNPQKSYKGLAVAGFAAAAGAMAIAASIAYEFWDYANSGAAINKGFIHDAYAQSAAASIGGVGKYAENYGMDDAAEGMTHYIVAERAPAFESANTAPEAAFTFRQDDCVAVTGTSGGFNKVAFEDLNGDKRTVFVAQENVRRVPASGPGCKVK